MSLKGQRERDGWRKCGPPANAENEQGKFSVGVSVVVVGERGLLHTQWGHASCGMARLSECVYSQAERCVMD